jgi:glycogen synthase kinase 3 beta
LDADFPEGDEPDYRILLDNPPADGLRSASGYGSLANSRILSPVVTSGGQSPNRAKLLKKIGSGTFGQVFEARWTGQKVAVKQIPQDGTENRELAILIRLASDNHPNIVNLLHHYEQDKKLCLVLELMPCSLQDLLQRCPAGCRLPSADTRAYMQQLTKALAHLELCNICHRDLKPANVLVDFKSKMLKLADFGSAKVITKGVGNTTYITTRFYRAPEAILDNPFYDSKLDSWALGCLFAEMIAARVIFRGKDSLDQLIQIMRKLGTPTVEQLIDINPALDPASIAAYANLRTVARSWASIMGHTRFTPEMQDLLTGLLEWSPKLRLSATEALSSAYVAENSL